MPSTNHRHVLALCVIAISLAASPALAQNYGPNPGTPGFVPLVSGPMPAGTGGVDADGNVIADDTTFNFGNNTWLSFTPGHLTFTLSNNSGIGGLYDIVAALGNLDFVYESMLGMQVRVTSTVSDAAVVIDLDFSGTSQNNSPPIDDGMNSSPGNPLAN